MDYQLDYYTQEGNSISNSYSNLVNSHANSYDNNQSQIHNDNYSNSNDLIKELEKQNDMNDADNDYDDDHNSTDDRIEKNRERNREHAKKTRLRKKAMIESMKGKLLELQREALALEQKLEEKSTANILLCLSVKHDTNDKFEDYDVDDIDSIDVMKPKISKGNIIDQLRYQVRAEAAHVFRDKYELLSNKIHALTDEAMSKSNCNSTASSKVSNSFPFNEEQVLQIIKSEKECPESCDNADVLSGITCMDQNLISNNQEDQFSNKTELNSATDPKLVEEHTFEVIKKERNRMHAKLTRDRKKLFTTQLQQAISSLERKNAILRNRLQSLTPGSTVDTDTDVQSGTTVSSFKTDSRSSDGSITSCSASPNRNYTSNGHKRSKLNNANAGVIIG